MEQNEHNKKTPTKRKPRVKEAERTAKNKAAILIVLENTLGVVTTACKQSGIPRPTFYNWVRLDEKFAEDVESVQDVALDFAESQLFKQIKLDIPSSTIFYLKTKGKKRGYIERTEFANINAPAFIIKPEQKGVMKVLKNVEQKNKLTG